MTGLNWFLPWALLWLPFTMGTQPTARAAEFKGVAERAGNIDLWASTDCRYCSTAPIRRYLSPDQAGVKFGRDIACIGALAACNGLSEKI
jgi:hypothetical protein